MLNFERFPQVNSQGSFTFVMKNFNNFSLIISPRELGGSSPHYSASPCTRYQMNVIINHHFYQGDWHGLLYTNSGIIIYDDKQCAVSCCCCYPYCSNIFTNSSMSRVPSPSCRYFTLSQFKIEQFNHPSALPCRLLSWTRPLHPWWGLFPGSLSPSSAPSVRPGRPCFGQKSG